MRLPSSPRWPVLRPRRPRAERFARARIAFTLIELLVVVGIIAILAAIAIPSLLEAQTRSKVSAAKANLRTGLVALEVYAVDNNAYPAPRAVVPGDPLGVLAIIQLRALSTPIAYLTSTEELRDPFGAARQVIGATLPAIAIPQSAGGSPAFPEIQRPNNSRSLLYTEYRALAARYAAPALARRGAALVSIGPDRVDSYGAFGPVSPELMTALLPASAPRHPADVFYDPTNGTLSAGDIPIFAGAGAVGIRR